MYSCSTYTYIFRFHYILYRNTWVFVHVFTSDLFPVISIRFLVSSLKHKWWHWRFGAWVWISVGWSFNPMKHHAYTLHLHTNIDLGRYRHLHTTTAPIQCKNQNKNASMYELNCFCKTQPNQKQATQHHNNN